MLQVGAGSSTDTEEASGTMRKSGGQCRGAERREEKRREEKRDSRREI